jgi:molybdate transport system ATP-binding protein
VSLEVSARHHLGAFWFDVTVDIGPGLTALIGPSGAGKTTLLNIVAGLVRPTDGSVRLDGATLADTRTGAWQPPYRRQIGYVFQEPRLLPHLTVRQNLGYARWAQRQSPGAHAPGEIVDLLNLGALLGRYPSRLSGGEKQRVALGRALLSRPRLLLFDEPLASVDQVHRDTILPYLDRLRTDQAIPTVYVTHAWREVAGRADQVVALGDGRVVFAGTPADAEARRISPTD